MPVLPDDSSALEKKTPSDANKEFLVKGTTATLHETDPSGFKMTWRRTPRDGKIILMQGLLFEILFAF